MKAVIERIEGEDFLSFIKRLEDYYNIKISFDLAHDLYSLGYNDAIKYNVFNRIREIYSCVDLTEYELDYFLWCLKIQIREIERSGRQKQDVLKEFADILLVAAHAIESYGENPERVALSRLEGRHVGKVQDILEKYLRMYHVSRGDLCQVCGQVLYDETSIKFLCCQRCGELVQTGRVFELQTLPKTEESK